MKIVVTGGAGFIGANLGARLGSIGGHEVVALDDLSTGRVENLRGVPGVDLVVGSILDGDVLRTAVAGARSIVHLAARPSVPRSIADPVASHDANATGTVNVLEAARAAGVPHVIVASSSSVYGANPAMPKHEDLAPQPMSPYAASKLAAESYALAYRGSFGLDVLALRFFNVFGPLQPAGHAYAAVVPAFIAAALDHRPLPLHGDGSQTRDFTYVGDVVAVLADAALRRVTSDRPVNLAFGTRTSLLEVIELLRQTLGHDLTIEHLETRPGDVRHSQADQRRFRQLFPEVIPTPLVDGLAATVEWFRSLGSH